MQATKAIVQNIDKPTQADIDAWKEKHGDIRKLGVANTDYYCIVFKPGRKELSYANSTEGDAFTWNESLLKTVWLGGSPEILTNEHLFLSICAQLLPLVKAQESYMEKL